MEGMTEWFGLKEGHKDFTIENDTDSRLLFARSQLDDQLQAILRKSFRTGNPPKFVLYGDWGVGKTHTMRHISHVIETTDGYDAQTIFVELPDINAKSTFQVAHASLLDAIGMDRAKQWMFHYNAKHQSKSQGNIQTFTQSEDIAKAFLTLIGYGDSARVAWDWLRGIALPPNDARNAGLPPTLNQSTQLVAVLRMLGRLSIEIDGKLLIVMIDEADKLNKVTSGDAIGHWVNSIKILSDTQTNEVGIILSASFRDIDDMPDALADAQIQSRFGLKHYIQLQNFGNDETAIFIKALLDEWVDPAKRAILINTYNSETDKDSISDETFPFTAKSLPVFVEYCCRNGGVSNPRDIQKALDEILNRAIDDGRHLVSKKYIDSVLAAG